MQNHSGPPSYRQLWVDHTQGTQGETAEPRRVTAAAAPAPPAAAAEDVVGAGEGQRQG